MGGLSKRERILLAVLLICAIGFVYYKYILTPQLDRLELAKKALEDNRQKLQTLIIEEKNLDKLKEEVDKLAVRAKESEEHVPDTSKVPEIIMDIKDMTADSECNAGSLRFGGFTSINVNSVEKQGSEKQGGQNMQQENTIAEGVAMVLPMTYEIKGNYNSVRTLLSYIEDNKRKMVVDNISMNKNTSGESDMLTVGLSISTLFRRTGEPDEPINYPFLNISTGKSDIFK